MATVQKRGNTYKVTVNNGLDIAGKQIREYATFTPDISLTPKQQQKALEKFVFEFEQAVINGKYMNGEKITLKEFADKWLEEYGKQQLSPRAYNDYENILEKNVLPQIGHLKLSKIKPLHIQQIYNKWTASGLSPATVKKRHAVISIMLKTAVKWLIIDSNPCEKITLPKANREMSDIKYFTPEQVNIFLQALGEAYTTNYKEHTRVDDTGKPYTVKEYTETRELSKQLQLFFTLALFTGLRRGELIALTWADVDVENNMLDINKAAVSVDGKIINKATKTKTSKRRVSIPKSVIPLLKANRFEQMQLRLKLGNLWEGDNYVFIQWNGKQMHPDTATHAFRDIIKRHNNSEAVKKDKSLELPLIPLHGLRHTNATLLIASNQIDVKTVQKHLGHANSNTTLNIYAHPLEELEKTCADTIESYIKVSK